MTEHSLGYAKQLIHWYERQDIDGMIQEVGINSWNRTFWNSFETQYLRKDKKWAHLCYGNRF